MVSAEVEFERVAVRFKSLDGPARGRAALRELMHIVVAVDRLMVLYRGGRDPKLTWFKVTRFKGTSAVIELNISDNRYLHYTAGQLCHVILPV